MKRDQQQEQRRAEAQKRQAAYDSLSLTEKYERAISRGHFRSREAKRLRALLKAEGLINSAGVVKAVA